MGKPVVNKHTSGQRENLGFVLHPSERGGKDHTVEISLEIATHLGIFSMKFLKTQSSVAY